MRRCSALRSRVTQSQDVVLGLLSGNYRQAVPIKLTAVGIEPSWFPITAFGDEAETRADLVLLAMEKYRSQVWTGRQSRTGDRDR